MLIRAMALGVLCEIWNQCYYVVGRGRCFEGSLIVAG